MTESKLNGAALQDAFHYALYASGSQECAFDDRFVGNDVRLEGRPDTRRNRTHHALCSAIETACRAGLSVGFGLGAGSLPGHKVPLPRLQETAASLATIVAQAAAKEGLDAWTGEPTEAAEDHRNYGVVYSRGLLEKVRADHQRDAEKKLAREAAKVAAKAARNAGYREALKAAGFCLACATHYGDEGECDEGKPVASPHRKPATATLALSCGHTLSATGPEALWLRAQKPGRTAYCPVCKNNTTTA